MVLAIPIVFLYDFSVVHYAGYILYCNKYYSLTHYNAGAGLLTDFTLFNANRFYSSRKNPRRQWVNTSFRYINIDMIIHTVVIVFQDFASPVQIAEVNNAKTHKKMAGVLSCVLFERSVLAASSVTGKSKEGRPALDPEKVQLIIGRPICYIH